MSSTNQTTSWMNRKPTNSFDPAKYRRRSSDALSMGSKSKSGRDTVSPPPETCLLSSRIPHGIDQFLPPPLLPLHNIDKTITILTAINNNKKRAAEKKVAAANAAFNKAHGIKEVPAMVRINGPGGTYIEEPGFKVYYPPGWRSRMEKEYSKELQKLWKSWDKMAFGPEKHRCEYDGCCDPDYDEATDDFD